MNRRNQGFTAVELLISIVVGALLLGSGFQLYSTIIRDSGAAQSRATASNVAYDFLRQYQLKATIPCTTLSQTPVVPSYAKLSNATINAVITCPYVSSSNLSLVTITVTYNNPNQEKVTRAVTTRPKTD